MLIFNCKCCRLLENVLMSRPRGRNAASTSASQGDLCMSQWAHRLLSNPFKLERVGSSWTYDGHLGGPGIHFHNIFKMKNTEKWNKYSRTNENNTFWMGPFIIKFKVDADAVSKHRTSELTGHYVLLWCDNEFIWTKINRRTVCRVDQLYVCRQKKTRFVRFRDHKSSLRQTEGFSMNVVMLLVIPEAPAVSYASR